MRSTLPPPLSTSTTSSRSLYNDDDTSQHSHLPPPSERPSKLERLRRKFERDSPNVPPSPSLVPPTDDARSIAFSINSDESVHTVTFTTRTPRSPHPHKTRHAHRTGALPPVPVHAHCDGDDVGLLRPRTKMPAGSTFGDADFKAARRAKREGRTGMAEPGEMVEMVGFL